MTRQCSYCGERGHNRRTCPKIDEVIKKNPDSYLARERQRREARQKIRVQQVQCSYCGGFGHNKAGCSDRKQALKYFSEWLPKWRELICNQIKKHKLGIGSLVKTTNREYFSKKERRWKSADNLLYIITGYDLNQNPNYNYQPHHGVVRAESVCGESALFLHPMDRDDFALNFEVLSDTDKFDFPKKEYTKGEIKVALERVADNPWQMRSFVEEDPYLKGEVVYE